MQLENHADSMARLQATMQRLKANLTPEHFIEEVSTAFQDAGASQSSVESLFRKEPSFEHFREALERAHATCKGPASILVLGCGRGFAGVPASFAATVVREVFTPADMAELIELDLTPAMLNNYDASRRPIAGSAGQRYDLIVAHSLLHFLPGLASFFSLVHGSLKPSGSFVLSHEPNARFWRNGACRRCLHRLQRARRLRVILSALKQRVHPAASKSAAVPQSRLHTVNAILRQRHGFTADLTEEEMRRIVDVHRPPSAPSTFKIGLDGFDFEQLGRTYLSQFHLAWLASSGHMGYYDVSRLSAKWKRAEQRLSNSFPLDGSVFTSLWKLA